jgi:hypothetical protein
MFNMGKMQPYTVKAAKVFLRDRELESNHEILIVILNKLSEWYMEVVDIFTMVLTPMFSSWDVGGTLV